MPRLSQPADPRRVQVLDIQRAVTGRPLRDRDHPNDIFQPARHGRIVVRFDVRGEVAAFVIEAIIQPVDAGVDQPDHVLRAGRLGQARVLRGVELTHQRCGIACRQPVAPQPRRDLARAGAHAATIHEAAGRLQRHDHHRSGRGGVMLRNKRLIDPPAGKRHAVGQFADDVSNVHAFSVSTHQRLTLSRLHVHLTFHVSVHRPLARLAIHVLLLDPGVGLRQAVAERRVRLPAQHRLDEGVVAVTAGDSTRGVELVLARQLHAADLLGQRDQVVDLDQFAGAQVNRRRDQLLAVHDHVDALDAVVDIHEAAGLRAVAPDLDLAAAAVLGGDHLTADGRRGLLAAAVPGAVRAVDVVEAGDVRLQPTLLPVLLAEDLGHQLFPAVAALGHGGVGVRFLQRPDVGILLDRDVVRAGR